jgi:hypothetical protein
MKKIGLHIDALAVIIIIFIMSFGFNFYQRYQYSDLLKEHLALQQRNLGMEFSLASLEARLNALENDNNENSK